MYVHTLGSLKLVVPYYFNSFKMKTSSHFSTGNRTLIHSDLLAMDVSWTPKDLQLFENEFDFFVSMVCTIARFITFVMAIVVHRAFYRLMKRLPGRAVNQVIYPYMVSKRIIIKRIFTTVDFRQFGFKINSFSWTPKSRNYITK